MFKPALLYAYALHCALASICGKGDNTNIEISQHPSEVEAKYGDNVTFTCIIPKKYNVSIIFVIKDSIKMMIRNGSLLLYGENNIFFSGTNHNFTVTVSVRNQSDSNTYYCDAKVQGQASEVCGAGTFVKILVTANGSLFKGHGILITLGIMVSFVRL